MTPSGISTVKFTLAVNRNFSNGQGEREVDFIPVVAWRKQAENVSKYLQKGSLAGIDGRLQVRSYDGENGKRMYVSEVVADTIQFLEPKKNNSPYDTYNQDNIPAKMIINEEDLPF